MSEALVIILAFVAIVLLWAWILTLPKNDKGKDKQCWTVR